MAEWDPAAQEGVERRRFLKAAATVAWASPLILTMTASRAGAQSCIPRGATCSACPGGLNCCIQGSDTLPCCCSNASDVTTCAGVCRTQSECITLFPGGPSTNPTSCFYPGGTGVTTTASLTASGKSKG